MNILIDEIISPSNTWAKAPRQVSVALTNACDLSCPHCYAPKTPAILDFNQLSNWLTDLDVNQCLGVGFGGGEPTMYPRLTELCSYVSKKTSMALIMTTHAHRLSDHFLSELAGNINFVRISMDGVGKTYEAIRCRPFNILVQRMKAIGKLFRFGINYLVNSETIQDLDMAVSIAEDLGASELLLIPEVSIGKGIAIDSETETKLKDWVCSYTKSVPLAVSEGGAAGLPICNPTIAEKGLSSFASIDASGRIKRTSYDQRGIKIEKDGIIEALNKLNKFYQEEIR